MKVNRVSGLPLEPEDIPKYQEELNSGLEALHQELGRFETLNQTKQGEFVRRFEKMREEVQAKYKFEDEWDFNEVVTSKTKVKQLVNKYGVVAFARSNESKQVQFFIIDK